MRTTNNIQNNHNLRELKNIELERQNGLSIIYLDRFLVMTMVRVSWFSRHSRPADHLWLAKLRHRSSGLPGCWSGKGYPFRARPVRFF